MSTNTWVHPKHIEAAAVVRMPKTYFGVIDSLAGWQLLVEQGGVRQHVALRLDVANHSPTGVSWGYHGSGPAQCALAILCDALRDVDRARRLYQRFKCAYVAQWRPAEPWALTETEIKRWVAETEAMIAAQDSGDVLPFLGALR
jgi:hypothetical protein